MEHGAHSHSSHAALPPEFAAFGMLSLLFMLIVASAYLVAVYRLKRAGRAWPAGRTLSFQLACLLLAVGMAPTMMQLAHGDFRFHMLQHLLIGMLAPLGLALGAPVSLLLRSLPRRQVRMLRTLLHGSWIRFVSHPVSALVLNVGGMYLLYLGPLYGAMHTSLPLYTFIHLHFVLAGWLFAWSILGGPDATPRQHAPAFRLGTLFVGIAAHALLAKLMYAYGWPAGTSHALDEIQAGALWMYYGGDFAELLLLVALFARWKALPKRTRLFRDEASASRIHDAKITPCAAGRLN